MKTTINVADKETLDKVYGILTHNEDDDVYGFVEHMDIMEPYGRIEYIGKNKDYTPMSISRITGEANYGSWGEFEFLQKNKPWMVHADGTPDYRLNENDYTKKAEGGAASDVANTSYNGGAFAWIPKIYKQEYVIGNDRVVKFSMNAKEGFKAVGFTVGSEELEGLWIPMFYGSEVNSKLVSLSGLQPIYSKTTEQENDLITAFSSRARFFGGPIIEVLADIVIMLGHSTDTQEVFGLGNSSGYNSAGSPTYGVKANAVVGGGQFYGTFTGTDLNKIFHSIVLGSYQQWMRNPYIITHSKDGLAHVFVSKNYAFDVTGDSYQPTGIYLEEQFKADGTTQITGVFYPHKYEVIPEFGAFPVHPMNGSTLTGAAAGFWQNCTITAVSVAFGLCDAGRRCSLRARSVDNPATNATWGIGAADLLAPPVGVDPEEVEAA